jgi:hypothetical protein
VSSVSVTVLAALPGGLSIAGDAIATASSQANTNQSAAKSIDGCIDGYPGDSSCEWVARYQEPKIGAWLELNWATPHIIDRIVLYDRPNSNDRITGATITLSDGSFFTVGPLNNDGSATEYLIAPVEITSLRMTVDSLRGNVGLSEIEVFESPDVNHAPLSDAGADQTVTEDTTITLNSSGSYDIDGDLISYSWVQISGSVMDLSDSTIASPWFVSPADLPSDEQFVFRLDVSDGEYTSSDEVVITVIAANPTNIVPVADAGPVQTVDEGSSVFLDGSFSYDPDGDSLTYNWSQVSGQTITLFNATTATPDFSAPTGLSANEILVFELTVSDGLLTVCA